MCKIEKKKCQTNSLDKQSTALHCPIIMGHLHGYWYIRYFMNITKMTNWEIPEKKLVHLDGLLAKKIKVHTLKVCNKYHMAIINQGASTNQINVLMKCQVLFLQLVYILRWTIILLDCVLAMDYSVRNNTIQY